MKILVPTDFSNLSKVAAIYAVELAKAMKAKVILLSVISLETTSSTLLNWRKLEQAMVGLAQEEGDQLIREIKKQVKGDYSLSFKYMQGYPVESIIGKFAKANKINLIVMGTRGASGLKKVLLGSNAAAVINSSSIPVLSVPGDAVFRPVKDIVYATDIAHLKDEIKTMVKFAKPFDAAIHVLHVVPKKFAKPIDMHSASEGLVNASGYKKINFTVSRQDLVAGGVEEFVTKTKPEILAMFTHKVDLYEKLFGKSVTRHLAFHNKVPLLTFNKETMAKKVKAVRAK